MPKRKGRASLTPDQEREYGKIPVTPEDEGALREFVKRTRPEPEKQGPRKKPRKATPPSEDHKT